MVKSKDKIKYSSVVNMLIVLIGQKEAIGTFSNEKKYNNLTELVYLEAINDQVKEGKETFHPDTKARSSFDLSAEKLSKFPFLVSKKVTVYRKDWLYSTLINILGLKNNK